jgi:alpha-L-fucosidase
MKFVAAFHTPRNGYFPTSTPASIAATRATQGSRAHPPERRAADKGVPRPLAGKVDRGHRQVRSDLIWFDNGLEPIPDGTKMGVLAHFYNKAAERKKEVVVTYKRHDLSPGAGLLDLERGRRPT